VTDATQPADIRPVIALFCTRGMEAFLSNAIQGILRTGIEPSQILVGCPNNALESVKGVIDLYSDQIRTISNPLLTKNEDEMESYSSFGSQAFHDISWKKIFFIRQLIEIHPHVVYSDIDIAWIRNPLHYLSQVALAYPMAFQTEGLARFPPALCSGFASFVRCERTIAFLDAMIEFNAGQADSEKRLDDQAVSQQLVENDPAWLRDIYCLPEALFPNGLGYRNLQNAGEPPAHMEGELLPFVFHANWTIGFENKRKLLASTGTWLLEDIAHDDQPAEPPLLLTVIFPAFDIRGDIVDHVRLWTERQDFDRLTYRVLVVAGTETELDEASLRKALRRQDGLLRIPGSGRDADYWNAGAQKAATPWLLFVEAHGLPEPDSLSALAAWIAANPDGMACNFKINNVEGGRIGDLMGRWFDEIHLSWAAPSTWRRLHRTAFAIRRDVFEEAGPLVPGYGQFAPPLLSARLHQHGYTISLIPASSVNHEDSSDMANHHDDTKNYVRGEMDARSETDPVFFEKYFGPSPVQADDLVRPARYARSMLKGLVVAALHRPGEAISLLGWTAALLPTAFVSLRQRARLLTALIHVDQFSATYLALPGALRWRRFVLAHRHVVKVEQMLWVARNSAPALKIGPGKGRWPIDKVGTHAISSVYALEQLDDDVFRWTHPVFLLRLAPEVKGALTLETRNLRSGLSLSDIMIVVCGKFLSSEQIERDGTGNISFRIPAPSEPGGEIDVVVIASELCEPADQNGPGRRLGLPLFSIGFDGDHVQDGLPARP
jgi:Nucleotide-diphospho-sugar transferase